MLELLDDGKARLEIDFAADQDIALVLRACGQVPLPPYILRQDGSTAEDRNRYQTVYADRPGAVAAPTAGLHFTEELLQPLEKKGVSLGRITLHVGYGTFAPVRPRDQGAQHPRGICRGPGGNRREDRRTKKEGGRIWAVGTTTVRALEYAALGRREIRRLQGGAGSISIRASPSGWSTT